MMKRVSQKDLQKMYEAPSPDMEERIHQTIASLPVQVQEGKIMKRKWTFGTVLALVLVLVLGVAGLAGSGIFGGRVVDLNGNITEEKGYTDVEVQDHQAEWSYLEKLLETVPDGDYGVVLDQNHEAMADRWLRTLNTREEFDNAMAGVDYLTVFDHFPEGMEFEKAEITLICRQGAEFRMAEEHAEGQYTVRRYTVDEADTFIFGYRLIYGDPADPNRKASVSAGLVGPYETGYSISEGDSFESIEIPGMDKALLLHFDEWDLWTIHTEHELNTPLTYGAYPEEPEVDVDRIFTKEWYTIEGLSVSPESLKDIMRTGE